MAKKQRRRVSRGKSAPGKLSPEALEHKAREDLTEGRHREAIAGFKQLLKLEARAEWQSALAQAYAGRARELTAKGMLKEALVIWENRARSGEGISFEPDQAELLLRMGRMDTVLALFSNQDAIPPAERDRLRPLLAARHLAGEDMVALRLPPDDPVVLHGEAARTALAAYCAGDDATLHTTLAAIPFRSPYRDWVQILKALQRLPEKPEEAAGLLDRIDEASAFGRVRRAAQLVLLPETRFLETIADADESAARFACVLRGWPKERISFWEELNRLGTNPPPIPLLRFMHGHRKALGEDWIQRRGLRLLLDGYPISINWPASIGLQTPDAQEALLLNAWDAERREDLWDQQELWNRYAHHLAKEAPDEGRDGDRNLRIALALRRCDRANDLLSDATPSNDPDDLDRLVAGDLEESLARDPDDRETYLRLIRYHRRGKQLKVVRKHLEQARKRWPKDMGVFEAALDTALDAGAFKKAAGLAREMLALDPINSGVRERLVDAHLSHARKQTLKGRADLARKELADAREWARSGDARDQLDLNAGLITLIEDATAGAPALRDMVARFGGGLTGRLVLALAADALRIPPQKLFKRIGLAKPSAPVREDLLATFARLRAHLDNGGKIRGDLAAYFSTAFAGAPWKDLSRGETESACETLARCRLDQVRLRVARAALKRWKGEPVFELHAFEARSNKRFDAGSINDISRLERAVDRAREQGDMRTALRIEKCLADLNPFGFAPPPAMPTPGAGLDDPEMDAETLAMLIEMIGLDKALSIMGIPPETKAELEKMSRQSGNRAVAEAIIAMSDMLFGAFDGDGPLPVPKPAPRRSPKRKADKREPRASDDSDRDDDSSDQLDLFS